MIKKFFLVLILGLCFFTVVGKTSAALTIGMEAPPLKLPDLENDIFDLSSLKGKNIILNFWASWSEPSLLELIFLGENYASFKKKNFEVVSINLDQRPAAAKFFSERRQLPFPVLLDLRLISPGKYRLLVVPTTFIIKKDFTVSEILVNFDDAVLKRLHQLAKI
jgi:peroxiredoxin